MGPGTAILTALGRPFRFSGRAGRSEFWWSFPILIALVYLLVLYARLPLLGDRAAAIIMIVAYLLMLRLLAVGTRRLGDAGMPRWLFVISWLLGQVSLMLHLVWMPMLRELYLMNFEAERNDVVLPLAPHEIRNILHTLRDDVLPWGSRILGLLALALALLPTKQPAIVAGTDPVEVNHD